MSGQYRNSTPLPNRTNNFKNKYYSTSKLLLDYCHIIINCGYRGWKILISYFNKQHQQNFTPLPKLIRYNIFSKNLTNQTTLTIQLKFHNILTTINYQLWPWCDFLLLYTQFRGPSFLECYLQNLSSVYLYPFKDFSGSQVSIL